MQAREKLRRYKTQSIHYFENALKSIETGDAEKASEFLWGSMSQSLKALAASKDMRLRGHKDLRDYALEVARQVSDVSIKHAFEEAQSLHINFYESGLSLEDVALAADDIKVAVGKLLSLIPQES